MRTDTIAAISTAAGEAAISILRLSGPGAIPIADQVFRGRRPVAESKSREMHLGRIVDGDGAAIDQAMVVVQRGPASYTGEDVVELHCHGGVLITRRVLELLLKNGARQADAGEFTQRAFLNGKMDLTQAEAVMDLIHAHSTLAIRAANEQLEGAIGRQAGEMRGELVEVLAHVEAFIDFPEEDIAPETGAKLIARLDGLLERTRKLLATSEQGRLLRHGARTVICGEPNVGKSSLLNLLLGFDRAIVSATAGTTRDTIEDYVQVHGIALRLVDTAGLRDSGDEIERSGMDRAARELERADLVIEVVDGTRPAEQARRVAMGAGAEAHRLLVVNKHDLGLHPSWNELNAVRISCATGEGLDELRAAIAERVMHGNMQGTAHLIAINARHQACFERGARHLQTAKEALRRNEAPELVALDLREALQALGEVTGRIDAEEILDQIFRSFCIGK